MVLRSNVCTFRTEDVIYIISTPSFPHRYPIHERVALEAEIIRRCLSRTEYQCSFLEYRGLKIIYRRYASLFFVVAVDGDEEVSFWNIQLSHDLLIEK
jgi:Clathrin adaptor complex small chain